MVLRQNQSISACVDLWTIWSPGLEHRPLRRRRGPPPQRVFGHLSVMIGWSDTRLQLISGNLFLSPPWKVNLISQCLPHGGNSLSGSAEARHVSPVPSQEFSGEAGAKTAALDRWDGGNLPTGSHRIGILVMIVHLVIRSSGELQSSSLTTECHMRRTLTGLGSLTRRPVPTKGASLKHKHCRCHFAACRSCCLIRLTRQTVV